MFVCPLRYLTHSELSPLRAPLIPMEHCTTRFFDECDADSDNYIALEEWAACFGVKEREYLARVRLDSFWGLLTSLISLFSEDIDKELIV